MKNLILIILIFSALTLYAANVTPSINRDRDYCESFWNNATDDWITNVQFNTIDNTTVQDGGEISYGDYTSIQTEVVLGETYDLSMSWFSDGFIQYGKVWIDWNSDDIFDDELEGYEVGFGPDMTLTTQIIVPWDAVADTTRMRVSEGYGEYPTPCNDAAIQWGETEDYSVIVTGDVQNPGTLNGVVSLSGGTGLVEEVTLLINNLEEHPDADGNYSISLLPGSYSLQASIDNYFSYNSENLIIEADSVITLDFELQFIESHTLPYLETFNAGLPADWQVINVEDDEFSWSVITGYEGESLNESQFAFVNSDIAGDSGTQLTESLISPAIQCDTASSVMLSFESYYKQRGNQTGQIHVWDGTNWQQVQEYESTHGYWGSPSLQIIDLTAYKNDQLRVKFLFDDAAEWNWFWAIDNVQVYEAETGSIEGYVYEAGTTNPISEAQISTDNYTSVSDENGFYQFLNLPIGQYSLECNNPYYITQISESILVEVGEVSSYDFELGWSEILLNPETIEIDIPQNTGDMVTIEITNNGNESLEFHSYLQYDDPSDQTEALSIMFDSETGSYMVTSIDMNDPLNYEILNTNLSVNPKTVCFSNINDFWLYGIDEIEQNLIWINKLTGEDEVLADCNTPMENGSWTGMAGDRSTDLVYGICSDLINTNLYTINIQNGNTELISELDITAGSGLAIDNSGRGYVLDLESDSVYKVNLQNGVSTILGEAGFDLNYTSALAWNSTTDQIYMCVISNDISELRILDREDGSSQLLAEMPMQITGLDFSYWWDSWAKLQPVDGVVNPGESIVVECQLSPYNFAVESTIEGTIVLENNSNFQRGDNYLLPVTMNVGNPISSEENEVAPLISQLLGNYPNPFNPTTEIRFQISEFRDQESAEIEIYNVKGQKINTFVCHPELDEGRSKEYSVSWNGTDRNNNPVSSGMYLYKLKVGNKTIDTKKMMLLK